jgi:hypothetical protein
MIDRRLDYMWSRLSGPSQHAWLKVQRDVHCLDVGAATGVSLIVDWKIAAVHDVKIINAQTMCQCSLIP